MQATEAHTPRVSVLIPVYNTGKYLAEAIMSILNQTFTDFELILCDDGSTDNSLEVARSFTDPRVKVLANEHNMGSSMTRNRLLDEARGEFCAIFDSDDTCYDYRLQTQVDFLDSHPEIDFCTGILISADENAVETGRLYYRDYSSHEEIKARMLFGCSIAHSTVMFRREKFMKHGLRYEPGHADDVSMYREALEVLRFENILTPLCVYRRWDGQTSAIALESQIRHAMKSLFIMHERLLGTTLTEEEQEMLYASNIFRMTKTQLGLFREYAFRLLETNKTKKSYGEKELKNAILLRYRKSCTRKKTLFEKIGLLLSFVSFRKKINKF